MMEPLEKLVRVRFDPTSRSAGFAIALNSSSVTWTKDPNEFIVPEDTVNLLREKKISFKVITDVSG